MMPGRLLVWAGFCSFDLLGGSAAARHPPHCRHRHMPGSFFSRSPIFRINQAVGSQDAAKKSRHSFGGAERRAKPSEPTKALPTTYLHKCIQKKNYNFQSSKAETLLFETLSRRGNLVCCCGGEKSTGSDPSCLLGSRSPALPRMPPPPQALVLGWYLQKEKQD